MANSVSFTMAYKNTNFKRQYVIDDVETSALADVKAKVMAINASLAGGTDDGLSAFFRADDYDAGSNVGEFASISAASYETVTETIIEGVG